MSVAIAVPVALVVLAAAAILAAPKPGTQPNVKLPDLPKYEIKSWDEIKQDLNALGDKVVGAVQACAAAAQAVLSKAKEEKEEAKEDATEEESVQDKPLSKGEIKKLKDADIDPHDLKPKKNGSKYDLFKDKAGNIKVKPKDGSGPGEPTGLNINAL